MCCNTLKSIRLAFVFLFYIYISCFSSIVSAKDLSHSLQQEKQGIINIFTKKPVSTSVFNNNDELNAYKTRSTIILHYLNAVLHRILDNNSEILSKYGMKKEDIEAKFIIDNKNIAFSTSNEIVLVINEYDLLHNFLYDTDVYIEATFSHEIAHIIKRHNEQNLYAQTELLNEFIQNHKDDKNFKFDSSTSMNPKYYKKFIKYVKTNQGLIHQYRQQEIEADNLGFKLFLNTKFNAEHYAEHFVSMRKITYTIIPLWITFCLLKDHLIRLYEGSNYPSTTPEQYRLMFTRYIEKIDKKIENYRYSHNFMEKMVHSLVKDIPVHPTIIWRFWNILKQEPEFKNETMDKSITTTEYVKLDLSRFEKLEDIRAILNTPYSSNDILNINDKNDPRFYIINTLLDDNSNISYTFFSSSSPIDSIGVIQEDNTVVLRANDVFRVAALSLVKDIDSLSPLCTRLFSKSSKITNEIMKITIRHYIKTGVSIFIFIKLLQYMF